MKRVVVFITARPQYCRLKSVMHEINNNENLELYLCVGGSALSEKQGRIDRIIEDDGFFISDKIYFGLSEDEPCCMTKSTAMFALSLADIFYKIKPTYVVVHADRYEQLAIAMAASYSNTLVVHMQGGEVTGSIDDKVRDMITQSADIHFPCTERARERIVKMICSDESKRWKKDFVFNVGCPSIDLLLEVNFFQHVDFNDKYRGVGCNIDYSRPYIVVLFHPDTTEYDLMEYQTEELIDAVREMSYQTVWFWPNGDAGNEGISKAIRRSREKGELFNVRFEKNYTPEDFVRLTANSAGMIGNTSYGIREGSFLNIPYVCLGGREKNREHGDNTVFSECEKDSIIKSFKKALKCTSYGDDCSNLYGQGDAAKRIVQILTNL